jgi:hypothetical protein
MLGNGDDDELIAQAKADRLDGDGQGVPEDPNGTYDGSLDGDDTLRAGEGDDELDGYGGADTLLGGGGKDNIVALEYAGTGEDTARAGGGGAWIAADDGVKDTITCGPGRDLVWFDRGIDVITNRPDCELLRPIDASGAVVAAEAVGKPSTSEDKWHDRVKSQFEEWSGKK